MPVALFAPGEVGGDRVGALAARVGLKGEELSTGAAAPTEATGLVPVPGAPSEGGAVRALVGGASPEPR